MSSTDPPFCAPGVSDGVGLDFGGEGVASRPDRPAVARRSGAACQGHRHDDQGEAPLSWFWYDVSVLVVICMASLPQASQAQRTSHQLLTQTRKLLLVVLSCQAFKGVPDHVWVTYSPRYQNTSAYTIF